MSDGEEALAFHLKAVGLSFVREVQFHPTRRWRFDFVVLPKGYVSGTTITAREVLAVEVEGGTFTEGRHTRGTTFALDAIKYAEALIAGWHVLRVTTDMVTDGRAVALIERAMIALSEERER